MAARRQWIPPTPRLGRSAARARSCHDKILVRPTDAGYPPVRLGIQSMHLGAPTEQVDVNLVWDLKRNIDPGDIMAPGRYDFRQHWGDPSWHDEEGPTVRDL